MPYISSPYDGAQLYYVDYKPAAFPQPFKPAADRNTNLQHGITLFFIHGWPMSGRMYEHLMLVLSETHGIRCIANDRRGFGKSEWKGPIPAGDITYDVFAMDTFAILRSIPDLGPFVFVAASMGGGESLLVHELMEKHGISEQCRGFIWLGPSMPHPEASTQNSLMPSRELWDSILDGFRKDRVAFCKASIGGVFGVPQGVEMSESAQEFYLSIILQADAVAIERCAQILIGYDFSEHLKKAKDMNVLILHGDKDQGMPAEASTQVIAKIAPQFEVKIYEMAAHGLYYTHATRVLEDMLHMLERCNWS